MSLDLFCTCSILLISQLTITPLRQVLHMVLLHSLSATGRQRHLIRSAAGLEWKIKLNKAKSVHVTCTLHMTDSNLCFTWMISRDLKQILLNICLCILIHNWVGTFMSRKTNPCQAKISTTLLADWTSLLQLGLRLSNQSTCLVVWYTNLRLYY